MKYGIKATAFQLEFRYAFHIAHGERTHTDSVYAEIISEGKSGYGEAALPPYLGYTAAHIVREISDFSIPEITIPEALQLLHTSGLSRPAKTALDIAFHDLWGKIEHKPVHELLGIRVPENITCFYTLGISSIEILEKKLAESRETEIYKIKLGSEKDHVFLKAFRERSNAAFCADANQAWKSKAQALEEIEKLTDLGCIFIEQPLPVDHPDLHTVHSQSKIPVYLDESLQSVADIFANENNCSGINLKLVKAGGIQPALKWVNAAQTCGLNLLIGCMSESSCGAAAALQLCGTSNYVDLDGPLLIQNDPFSGLTYDNGKLSIAKSAGLGINKKTII